jgi:hypothetical protein
MIPNRGIDPQEWTSALCSLNADNMVRTRALLVTASLCHLTHYLLITLYIHMNPFDSSRS